MPAEPMRKTKATAEEIEDHLGWLETLPEGARGGMVGRT